MPDRPATCAWTSRWQQRLWLLGVFGLVATSALRCTGATWAGGLDFQTLRTFPLGDTVCIACVTSMATADVNGDGALDAVVAVQTPVPPFLGSIIVALGDAQGCYDSWTRYWFTSATEPYALVLADFTGDGHLDVCTANLSTDNLSILVGFGDGTFAWTHNIATSNLPDGLIAGDVNHDGALDLVSVSNILGHGRVHLGDGQGGFALGTTLALPGSPGRPAIVDLDLDGHLDLIVVARSLNRVHMLLGNGLGGFTPSSIPPTHLNVGLNPQDLVVEDFNDDGVMDFATANSSSATVTVRFGDGAGDFPTLFTIGAGALPSLLHTADLDLDGDLDLVALSAFDGDGAILLGNGTGGFTWNGDLPVGQLPLAVTSSDLDGDGHRDLLVLLGVNALATLAGDGAGGLRRFLLLPAGQGPVSAAVGDLDENGLPDIVAVNQGSDSLSTFMRTTTGTFLTGSQPLGLLEPTEVTVAYVDFDSHLDVVVVQEGQGSFTVLKGDGLGGFVVGQPVIAGFFLRRPLVVDLDGDGDQDLLALDPGNDALVVCTGDGSGQLTPTSSYTVAGQPVDFVLGAFDGGGVPDVAVLTRGTLTLDPTLYLMSGLGGDASPPALPLMTFPEFGFRLVAADLDGNGSLDLALTTGVIDPVLRILSGDGTGGFLQISVQTVGGGPQDLLAVPLDGDALPDLVSVSILEIPLGCTSSTTGAPGLLQGFGVGAWPTGVVGSDLDGDGQIDLVVPCRDSDAIAVLWNRTLPPPVTFRRGDVTGDGNMALNDAVVLLSFLFVPGGSLACADAADLDDDGSLDLVDAVRLLGALFVPGALLPKAPYPQCGTDPASDPLPPCNYPPSSC